MLKLRKKSVGHSLDIEQQKTLNLFKIKGLIHNVVLGAGLEPARPYRHRILSPACLPIPPPERLKNRARNETRTRDPNLGKVVLYQLSYSRSKTLRLNEQFVKCSLKSVCKYKQYFYISITFAVFFYPPVHFFISFNFISASTGVKVLISIETNSSLICSKTGSFN